MTTTAAEPTTTTGQATAPECCGQPMTKREAFVTQRTFHRCDVCLRNDYSVGAFTHAHTQPTA